MTNSLISLLSTFGHDATMVLLALASLISIGIIVERWMFLRARHIDLDNLVAKIGAAMERGDLQAALAVTQAHPSMESQVGQRMLQASGRPRLELEDLYRSSVERERLRYERSLGLLATIGSNAPFIGLFGTVLGIVQAFAALSSAGAGAGRNSVILGAISEALVATAIGIAVAIPAVVAFNSFQRRVDRSVGASEVVFRELVARIGAR
jgi:biopolymer transport protein ExbB